MLNEFLVIVLEVGALLALYAAFDTAFRCEAWPRVWKRAGLSHRGSTVLLLAVLAPVMLLWGWPTGSEDGWALAVFASIHATMMAWKSGTDDVDVAFGDAWWVERALLALCAIGAWFSPAWVLVQLHLTTRPFIGWKHHGSLPLRVLQLAMSWSALHALGPWVGHTVALTPFVVALFMMLGSHYVITAVAKGMLGVRWFDWMLDNRLYYVAASSYRWGWARFLSESNWRRVLKVLAFANRPMQIGAWIVEAASPLMLLHPNLAIGLCGSIALFHVAVFISTGIFFWEWTVTNLLVIGLLAFLSPEVISASFGVLPWLLSAVLMLLLPLRGKLWEPKPLGWWDTPLTQRVQWRIIGESGTVYDLHNKFMCPHERNYGRVHGCFMIDVPVFTYHLGEVWRRDLRDAIWRLRDHPEEIDAIREKYGISVFEPKQTEQHVLYLKRFLQQINRGARKYVFPRGLRWMKAPGGQFYYWGDRPSFHGQERAESVEVWFTEEWWDGEVHHRFQERQLKRFDVEPVPEVSCEELDEKVVDAMVLQRANGRLVTVPDWLVEKARELYDPRVETPR